MQNNTEYAIFCDSTVGYPAYGSTFDEAEAEIELFLDQVQSGVTNREAFKDFLMYFTSYCESSITGDELFSLVIPILETSNSNLIDPFKKIIYKGAVEYEVEVPEVIIVETSEIDTDTRETEINEETVKSTRKRKSVNVNDGNSKRKRNRRKPKSKGNSQRSYECEGSLPEVVIKTTEIDKKRRKAETNGEAKRSLRKRKSVKVNDGNNGRGKSGKTNKKTSESKDQNSKRSYNLKVDKGQKISKVNDSVVKTEEISTSSCSRLGKHYYSLPLNHKEPKGSGRTALCDEVLNDTYKCIPIPSAQDDKHISDISDQERVMMEVEDERYELDMIIDGNAHTIDHLTNLQSKIKNGSPQNLSSNDSKVSSSIVLHQTSIQRLYGKKAPFIMKGLKKRPEIVIPIVVPRMKSKHKEWCDTRKKLNTVWKTKLENSKNNGDREFRELVNNRTGSLATHHEERSFEDQSRFEHGTVALFNMGAETLASATVEVETETETENRDFRSEESMPMEFIYETIDSPENFYAEEAMENTAEAETEESGLGGDEGEGTKTQIIGKVYLNYREYKDRDSDFMDHDSPSVSWNTQKTSE